MHRPALPDIYAQCLDYFSRHDDGRPALCALLVSSRLETDDSMGCHDWAQREGREEAVRLVEMLLGLTKGERRALGFVLGRGS
jgi:hypothetical protein